MLDKNETRNIYRWNFRKIVVPYLKKSLIQNRPWTKEEGQSKVKGGHTKHTTY